MSFFVFVVTCINNQPRKVVRLLFDFGLLRPEINLNAYFIPDKIGIGGVFEFGSYLEITSLD